MLSTQTLSNEPAWEDARLSLAVLTAASRLLPPVRGSGRVALSLLRPLCRHRGRAILPIWPGVRMIVDPHDSIGSLLAFVPHLYDRWERHAMATLLGPGDTFVDVGSNIGVYSMWAASLVGDAGRILAVEPDDQNFAVLEDNIRLNGFAGRIQALRCGISDQRQELCMHRNVTGNCGAHNFLGRGTSGRMIECIPLREALEQADMAQVRMMKLDIEGFERRVLEQYFRVIARGAGPQYLLVEIAGGPAAPAEKDALRNLILANGYAVLREGANTLFQRTDVREWTHT